MTIFYVPTAVAILALLMNCSPVIITGVISSLCVYSETATMQKTRCNLRSHMRYKACRASKAGLTLLAG